MIDDEPWMLLSITEALREWSYAPVGAGTIADALPAFDAECPGAVLRDIDLPDGSGLDALREIKSRQPEAVIIIVTGNVLVENTIVSLDAVEDAPVRRAIEKSGGNQTRAAETLKISRPGIPRSSSNESTSHITHAATFKMSSRLRLPGNYLAVTRKHAPDVL